MVIYQHLNLFQIVILHFHYHSNILLIGNRANSHCYDYDFDEFLSNNLLLSETFEKI